MNGKRNAYVSIIKFLAACFVVFLHVEVPGRIGRVLCCIARFSVPFFLSISGFYAYRATTEQIKKRLIKIILLTLFANCVYLIWECVYRGIFLHQNIQLYLLNLLSIKTIAKQIFMGISPFFDHLWYLPAMIIVYLLYLIYIKFWDSTSEVRYTTLYTVAICAFLFQIFFGLKAIGVDFQISYKIYRYGLFFGIPFFSLGLFMNQYQEIIIRNFKLSAKRTATYLILGFVVSALQWFGIGEVEVPIGIVLVVICVLILAICTPRNGMGNSKQLYPKNSAKFIESCATIIYVIHPLIHKIISAFQNDNTVFSIIKADANIYPFIIVIISLLVSCCISFVGLLYKTIICRYFTINHST